MIHKPDTCSELDAFAVGRLHSVTIGDTYRDMIQTTVRAKEKLSVSMTAGEFKNRGEFLRCRRIVDFYPEPNGVYEVVYIYSTAEDHCFYNVWKIEKDVSGKEVKNFEPTTKVRCFVK